ncbi:MAG: hypothetical protein Gaeavirus1_37 [Gaeavirus sp.]|uniref:Uncharacterized protein n=1 Tax=Gaeavirus sp. TaxID=2487767 RepID=A0A3G4ZYG5_9VIRU|nr:MAG: hypothetical protein Gaeavirus1_37 [Gaeavirus sp.]
MSTKIQTKFQANIYSEHDIINKSMSELMIEYNQLIQRYNELLSEHSTDSYPVINTLFTGNDDIIAENDILRNKIKELEQRNAKQDIRIDDLDKKCSDLQQTCSNLQETCYSLQQTCHSLIKECCDLKNDSVKRATKKLYKKYVVALQDINFIDRLERTANSQSRSKLIKLKKNRLEDCHYLDNTDEDGSNGYRRTILYQKLSIMPNDIKQLFEQNHDGLLAYILPLVCKTQIRCDDHEIVDEVARWWE